MSSSQSVPFTGVVESFDVRSGMGTIRAAGGANWPFHCVEIADGSRSIDVGATVKFFVEFRTLRREAVSIVRG